MTLLDDTPLRAVLLTGQPGTPGPAGPTGPPGAGVPNGGTTGQVLAKNSATNQDTTWVDPTAGGGSGGVPAGGTAGQVLTKDTTTDFDTSWQDPTGGGGGLATVTTTDSATIDFSGAGTVGSPLTASVLTGSISTGMLNFDVATQTELNAHTGAGTGAHAASAVSFAPAGSISSTTVQAAIAELDGDITGLPTLASSNSVKLTVPAAVAGVVTLGVGNVMDLTTDETSTGWKTTPLTWVTKGGSPTGNWPTVKHVLETTAAWTNDGSRANLIELFGSVTTAANIALIGHAGAAGTPAQTVAGNVLGRLTWRGTNATPAPSTAAAALIFAGAEENVTTTWGSSVSINVTAIGGTGTTQTVKVHSTSDVGLRAGLLVGAGTNITQTPPATAGTSLPNTGYGIECRANGIGYGPGAGGTVTQATSKATGVTLNKPSGQITLNGAALAATTSVNFTLTNSAIAATDTVTVSVASAATAGAYFAQADAVAAGSCRIHLRNISAASLSEAIVLNYNVVKGAAT